MWPTWKPFTRGEYALTYDPSAVTPATTETETETTRPRPSAPAALHRRAPPPGASLRRRVTELLTIDEALDRIVERARPPGGAVAVGEAPGVLREPATAYVDLPPFPSSAMDGFAVRAADTPGELPVAFRVAAGTPRPARFRVAWPRGSHRRDGPRGADAVVPVELVEDRGGHVVIAEAPLRSAARPTTRWRRPRRATVVPAGDASRRRSDRRAGRDRRRGGRVLDVPRSPCSPRAASCAPRRAARRARSTSRTGR